MEVTVSMASTVESNGDVLRSERIAGGILYKVLNTFDMVAIFIAIVLFITNAPGIASAGPVAYIYLVAGFLTQPWQLGLVILIVTAISFGLSIVRFRAAQNLVNIVFIAYGAAILLIGLAGLLWLVTGNAAHTNLAFNSGGWAITFGGTGN